MEISGRDNYVRNSSSEKKQRKEKGSIIGASDLSVREFYLAFWLLVSFLP